MWTHRYYWTTGPTSCEAIRCWWMRFEYRTLYHSFLVRLCVHPKEVGFYIYPFCKWRYLNIEIHNPRLNIVIPNGMKWPQTQKKKTSVFIISYSLCPLLDETMWVEGHLGNRWIPTCVAMVGENRRLVHYQPMDFYSWPVQISNHRMAIRL